MGFFSFLVINLFIVAFVTVLLFPKEYSIGEMILQFVITFAIMGTVFIFTRNYDLYDQMYVNGKVTDKTSQTFVCSNFSSWTDFPVSNCSVQTTRQKSYSCTKKRKSRTYKSTCYKTQYRSVYPWEKSWYVETSVGKYTIHREDSQGSVEPKRYTIAAIGDPVTATVSYKNYIKAASNSLFSTKENDQKPIIKRNGTYDYYKIENVYVKGNVIDVDYKKSISASLNGVNSNLTSSANLVMVFTDQDMMENLKTSWQGFKLNDLIIQFVVKEGRIEKSTVYSWSKSSIVNVELSDYFNVQKPNMKLEDLNSEETFTFIQQTVSKSYVKPKEEDYEYLKNDIHISTKAYVLILIFNLIISLGLSYIFVKNDIL